MRDYVKETNDVFSYMVEVRRHIHEYPCLTDNEYETAKYISDQLTSLGINHCFSEQNNIVAKIEGNTSKSIAVRADMDALPIEEETFLPFTSKNKGIMHACGHDFHVANLLGLAKVLTKSGTPLNGTVYLCFQVGEEQSKGADDIVNYLNSVGGVETCIGLHVDPSLEVGTVTSKPGALMAGSSLFDITVTGRGGHGSTPWLSSDPIKPACDIVLRIASLAATTFSSFDSIVINPCSIVSGTAGNIVPDTALIKGNIRYFKPGQLEEIVTAITSVIDGIAASYGVTAKLNLSKNQTPVMVASDDAYLRLKKVVDASYYTFEDMLNPWMASDNYSIYLSNYSGIYVFGGVTGKDSNGYSIHTSKFNPDEEALKVFCEIFLRYIDEFFGE